MFSRSEEKAMPQIINTNIMSLNSQRNLNRSQGAMQTALSRLSSGLRINSAKDDAAGLAISERFTSQIRGLTVAARNANDGISLSQVAEGSLGEVANTLQRIRELAVQSINATNSSTDRKALNNEVRQLTAELNRIAKTTEFNGQRLLDGSFTTALFQVGANANQMIVATTANFQTDQYGDYRVEGFGTQTATVSRFAGAGNFDVVGPDGQANITWTAGASAQDVADSTNLAGDSTGVKAYALTEVDLSFSSAGSYQITLEGDNAGAPATVGFTLSDTSGPEALSSAVTAINDHTPSTGVIATVKPDGQAIVLTHYDGQNINVSDTTFSNTGTVTITGEGAGAVTLANDSVADTSVSVGQVIFDSDKSFTLSGTAGEAITATAEAAVLQSVFDMDISNVDDANLALVVVDAALARVNNQRAKFGALQSRFEATIRNLETSVENLSGARSRIRDADFAAETSELTRTQILQQAGTAMLAQANQIPQNVLSLLQ
jgi:flagellin